MTTFSGSRSSIPENVQKELGNLGQTRRALILLPSGGKDGPVVSAWLDSEIMFYNLSRDPCCLSICPRWLAIEVGSFVSQASRNCRSERSFGRFRPLALHLVGLAWVTWWTRMWTHAKPILDFDFARPSDWYYTLDPPCKQRYSVSFPAARRSPISTTTVNPTWRMPRGINQIAFLS